MKLLNFIQESPKVTPTKIVLKKQKTNFKNPENESFSKEKICVYKISNISQGKNS